MNIQVITLFPEMFTALRSGIPQRAVEKGLLELAFLNPRDFTGDKHRTVDDRPYGGGPGMVMMVEPLRQALTLARERSLPGTKVIHLAPTGRPLDQSGLRELATRPGVILIASRYEGIDQRLLDQDVDEEWSIGDYVLSGGELPAMVLIDGIIRLLPGALGHEDSAEQDSFSASLLDYPHYTRPEALGEARVPEVLLSGDHAAIRRWRLKQSLGRTWRCRPDLLERLELDAEQRELLAEYRREHEQN